jgi:hypothetical protein
MSTPLHDWMERQKVDDDWLAEQLAKSRSQASRIRRNGTTDARVAVRVAEITGLPVASLVKSDEPQADAA